VIDGKKLRKLSQFGQYESENVRRQRFLSYFEQMTNSQRKNRNKLFVLALLHVQAIETEKIQKCRFFRTD